MFLRSPPEISCFAGSRAITFLCFARGAVGPGGVSHPLAGVSVGDRDRGGAVEVKSEAQVVLSDGFEIVSGFERHAGWDHEVVNGVALLVADVGLGGLVNLGGGRERCPAKRRANREHSQRGRRGRGVGCAIRHRDHPRHRTRV